MKTIELHHDEAKVLVKKFHVLLGQTGNAVVAKEAILGSYGVESSKDLNVTQLREVCDGLQRATQGRVKITTATGYKPAAPADLDQWRKRVIAAIFGYSKAMGLHYQMEGVKAIAARAAGVERFNSIPLDRLRSLYNAFNKRKKDIAAVDEAMADDMMAAAALN